MIQDLFQYDFLARAFSAGLVIAVLAPVVGTFLVVRRLSFLADTLAHVSLLGVAGSIFFGISPAIGAVVVSLLAALGVDRIRSTGRVMTEAVLALFLSVSLAAAVVIVSLSGVSNVNLMSYLFGSLATVSVAELVFLFVLVIFAFAFFLRFYRPLFLLSLDEDLAKVSGVRVGAVNTVFVSLTALTAAASLQIVGVLLLGALMVIPVLTALQFGRGFRVTILIAIGCSLLAFLVGFFLSYSFDLPSGGTIVLVAGSLFLLAFLGRKLSR
jgi:zinc transport system permease protein